MKKILAFFSAVAFLGSTTLAVSACGVSKGDNIEVVIKEAPKKAENNQDPLTEYVYNNQYNYSGVNANYLIALAGQTATDKIYNFKQPGTEWEEFYSSEVWQRKSFSSFHYEPTGSEDAFSFRGQGGQEFIVQLKNNDASDDTNKVMSYWFITSANPGDDPEKDNIVVPNSSEFNDDTKIITRSGWIHLFLVIGDFQIDFNAEINFNFTKITDVNNQPVVMLDITTFTKPLGDASFENPPYDRIANLALTKV
ncbi:hypothetical protein [Spiroplasma platyhelix]|uniref:Lipoprotein n=1 Tax=Spiroplasma platyhelix PALS-1 TaxID=1276218 RepID=A0A846U4Y5_9MOLU|nr:hypothetical protein [Spiroplasma platyhelix]MBE4704146.1 hypothetical protein [Spiroplasma platyhelix PALS-1]NKE38517.1 hypothetical protein [Spiroplasma platyhelix PALS-1]UJB29404.1 hypothetical protein SPLAT_v1c06400 [Spiroplasma platyhelix PALS-1]